MKNTGFGRLSIFHATSTEKSFNRSYIFGFINYPPPPPNYGCYALKILGISWAHRDFIITVNGHEWTNYQHRGRSFNLKLIKIS